MNNYSVIIKKIRTDKKLTLRQAAKIINRSSGWLSEVENCKQRSVFTQQEFKRIASCYEAENELRKYQLWASTQKHKQEKRSWYEGAIFKYLRLRRGLSLIEASSLINISKSQLSNIEASRRQVDLELRNKILKAYDYKPSSFHNYSNRESRAKSIPTEMRLKLLLRQLGSEGLEKVFNYARELHASS